MFLIRFSPVLGSTGQSFGWYNLTLLNFQGLENSLILLLPLLIPVFKKKKRKKKKEKEKGFLND